MVRCAPSTGDVPQTCSCAATQAFLEATRALPPGYMLISNKAAEVGQPVEALECVCDKLLAVTGARDFHSVVVELWRAVKAQHAGSSSLTVAMAKTWVVEAAHYMMRSAPPALEDVVERP